jgi:hypothetical protein
MFFSRRRLKLGASNCLLGGASDPAHASPAVSKSTMSWAVLEQSVIRGQWLVMLVLCLVCITQSRLLPLDWDLWVHQKVQSMDLQRQPHRHCMSMATARGGGATAPDTQHKNSLVWLES